MQNSDSKTSAWLRFLGFRILDQNLNAIQNSKLVFKTGFEIRIRNSDSITTAGRVAMVLWIREFGSDFEDEIRIGICFENY